MRTLRASVDGGCLELHVTLSRLDAASAADFRKECGEAWDGTVNRVVVDLNEVQFVDSSGVGALLGLYKRLPPPNPNVVLRHVQPPVQSVIELLRLHRIFELEP
jgi:anti-sigma B factor antagonist